MNIQSVVVAVVSYVLQTLDAIVAKILSPLGLIIIVCAVALWRWFRKKGPPPNDPPSGKERRYPYFFKAK